MPQTIKITDQGKTYYMPWSEKRDPTDDEIDNFITSQTTPKTDTFQSDVENAARQGKPISLGGMFKSFLPKAPETPLYTPETLPSFPYRAATEIGKGAYENLIRPAASPGGIATSLIAGGGALFPKTREFLGRNLFNKELKAVPSIASELPKPNLPAEFIPVGAEPPVTRQTFKDPVEKAYESILERGGRGPSLNKVNLLNANVVKNVVQQKPKVRLTGNLNEVDLIDPTAEQIQNSLKSGFKVSHQNPDGSIRLIKVPEITPPTNAGIPKFGKTGELPKGWQSVEKFEGVGKSPLAEVTPIGKKPIEGMKVKSDTGELLTDEQAAFKSAGIGAEKPPTLTDKILNVAGASKALTAGFDLSAPLRQGRMLAHKKEFWNSLKPMLEAAKSDEGYQALNKTIVDNEFYPVAKKSGINFTGIGDKLDEREESIMSNLPTKIPFGIGKGYEASNRAYTGFLNKLRMDSFASIIKDNNITDEVVQKQVARFINAATGRGSLGEFESSAKALNTLLFSPRMLASRLYFFNPKNYLTAPAPIRKEMLKSVSSFIGSQTAILSLATLVPGVSVGIDPTNADFAKIKVGHTRLDLNAGFQPLVKMFAQLGTGKLTSSNTGKVYDLNNPKFGGPNKADVALQNILFNKESPLASFVHDWLKGTDFEGQPFEIQDAVIKRITPMLAQDIYEIWQENPKLLPLFGTAAMFGGSVQSYRGKTPKRSRLALPRH